MSAHFAIITIAVALLLTVAVLWVRNLKTERFLCKLNNQIYRCAMVDLDNRRDSAWRWKEFDLVGYNRVWLTFWRPLRASAYWKDLTFLDPNGGNDSE